MRYLRWLGYEIASWWWMLSYTIRPYNMLSDQRRWFWRKPPPCQFQTRGR